jgi:predicted amidophosphoribosyltransferase
VPSRVVAELLAVVAPPACAACRAPLARADLRLCADCTRALPWMPARTCLRCGLPSHRRACPASAAAFASAGAPLAYDGVARELVAALKFRGALPVAALMAAHMAANLPEYVRAGQPEPRISEAPEPGAVRSRQPRTSEAPEPGAVRSPQPRTSDAPEPASSRLARPHRFVEVALVPVPPQPARARRRGFDPAGVLAAALAPRLGIPERACMRRRDRERRQVGATRAQRRRPGRLAIEVRGPPPARALLVDDVHTTGATLDACARALVAAGCGEVVALTYARTL